MRQSLGDQDLSHGFFPKFAIGLFATYSAFDITRPDTRKSGLPTGIEPAPPVLSV